MKTMNLEHEPTNLVHALTTLLTAAGHPRPDDWTRGLHEDANLTPDTSIQRFLINRNLRLILGECKTENTIDVRYCLVDSGDIKEWVRLMETMIVPCLVRNNLPPAMN